MGRRRRIAKSTRTTKTTKRKCGRRQCRRTTRGAYPIPTQFVCSDIYGWTKYTTKVPFGVKNKSVQYRFCHVKWRSIHFLMPFSCQILTFMTNSTSIFIDILHHFFYDDLLCKLTIWRQIYRPKYFRLLKVGQIFSLRCKLMALFSLHFAV